MITKLLNNYIKCPLLYDSIIILITISCLHIIQKYYITLSIDKSILNSLVNELISSSIGIAGFLITALTIILTFKDNLKSKDICMDTPNSETKNINSGVELLFHSKHYKRIVNVFFFASVILVFSFFYLALMEIVWDKLTVSKLLYLVFIPLIYIIMAVLRCLIILYKIIKLQVKNQ